LIFIKANYIYKTQGNKLKKPLQFYKMFSIIEIIKTPCAKIYKLSNILYPKLKNYTIIVLQI